MLRWRNIIERASKWVERGKRKMSSRKVGFRLPRRLVMQMREARD